MDWDDFLSDAVAEGDLELINQALAQGANPNAITGEGFFRHTSLFWAASGGNAGVMRLMLSAGANVASERNACQTSLHVAVEHNDLPIIELLLAADGDMALDWFDFIDRTPLMIAVKNGSLEVACRLVAAGADVNAHNEKQIGNTALREAAGESSMEMVQLLIRAGADPTIPGWMQITALDKAKGRKKPEGRHICELLERVAQEKRGKRA